MARRCPGLPAGVETSILGICRSLGSPRWNAALQLNAAICFLDRLLASSPTMSRPPHLFTRRSFTATLAAGFASLACPRLRALPAKTKAETKDLIVAVEKITLRRGRDGQGPTWFHPRACLVPGKNQPAVLMTLQEIAGSDMFGPLQHMMSADAGRTWTEPAPVPPLGRIPLADGFEEGVCDVVPEWHQPTRTVLALGHSVNYRGPKFSANQPPRWPVYAVWRNGEWGPRRKLLWADSRGAYIYTNNCGQRVVLHGEPKVEQPVRKDPAHAVQVLQQQAVGGRVHPQLCVELAPGVLQAVPLVHHNVVPGDAGQPWAVELAHQALVRGEGDLEGRRAGAPRPSHAPLENRLPLRRRQLPASLGTAAQRAQPVHARNHDVRRRLPWRGHLAASL